MQLAESRQVGRDPVRTESTGLRPLAYISFGPGTLFPTVVDVESEVLQMRRKLTQFAVLLSVFALVLMPAAVGTVAANHSEGDPPEDPGNNASEVPGVGRPPCIPPQDPGHGQPDCIPPENPPGQGGDNPGNGNGGGNGGGGQGMMATIASALGL